MRYIRIIFIFLFCTVHYNILFKNVFCSSPEPLSAAGLERKQGSSLEVESSSRGIESFLPVGRHKTTVVDPDPVG